MHARVSTYTGEAERLLDGFQSVTGPLEEMEGFSQAYFLVDRGNNKAISITIWESEDALLASASKADELRKDASDSADASIDSIEHYEIAITTSSKKARIG
jgi:heme-degrading monooxygenase HmoA